jgi:hypothetical protein
LLSELARSVGLDSKYEVVPPPGLVDLNWPNLIVLTNPRPLPFLSQVMGTDPHLGYAEDDQGWCIVDKTAGTEYRSPMDQGRAADFAYTGMLPRPDGKGTFLYLAGTHAPGTLAAAVDRGASASPAGLTARARPQARPRTRAANLRNWTGLQSGAGI